MYWFPCNCQSVRDRFLPEKLVRLLKNIYMPSTGGDGDRGNKISILGLRNLWMTHKQFVRHVSLRNISQRILCYPDATTESVN